MNDRNMLFGIAGGVAVWWFLNHRECHCDDHGSQPAATPPVAKPQAPASPLPPPIDTSPQYLPPVCPDGYLVGEGGSCYRTTMRDVPGMPTQIPYIDIAQPVCPPGYERQASSGSCIRRS